MVRLRASPLFSFVLLFSGLRLNAREMALSAISRAFSLGPGNNKTKENRGIQCSQSTQWLNENIAIGFSGENTIHTRPFLA